jgi:hypothetical protein
MLQLVITFTSWAHVIQRGESNLFDYLPAVSPIYVLLTLNVIHFSEKYYNFRRTVSSSLFIPYKADRYI